MKSRPIKLLSAKAVLFVLLALQLIVGLPLQAAQAALDLPVPTTAHSSAPIAAMATPVASTSNADCPMHGATHGADPASGGNKHVPAGNHDCCHVSACQCHCVYTPAALDLPPLGDVATSVALPSLSGAQFVAPRIDEFLRPPIV